MRPIFFTVCQLFLVSMAFAASGFAPSPTSTIGVHGVRIDIPSPKDFTNPAAISPDVVKTAQSMATPSRRVQLVLLSTMDMKRVLSGKDAGWESYFIVTTDRRSEEFNISERQFSQVRANFKAYQAKMMQSAKEISDEDIRHDFETIEKQAPNIRSLKVGEMRPLGMTADSTNVVGAAYLLVNVVKIEGTSINVPTVMAMYAVPVKRKLLQIFAYRAYHKPSDIDELRRVAGTWVADIIKANQ